MSNQCGGKNMAGEILPHTIKAYPNGRYGAYFLPKNYSTKTGEMHKNVFRFISAAEAKANGVAGATRATPATRTVRARSASPVRARKPMAPRTYKTITAAQAQAAYEKYYATNPTYTRGANKGQGKYTAAGLKRASTYDKNYSLKPTRVINDERYLKNPHAWDFQGVDSPVPPKYQAVKSAKLAAARASFGARMKAYRGTAGVGATARAPAATAATAATRARVARPRVAPHQISLSQAQDAFNKYYASNPTFSRGANKGQPRFKTSRAKTYDAKYSLRPARVINDSRYLTNPHAWDFQGVDSPNPPKYQTVKSAKLAAARAGFGARMKAYRAK